MKKTRRSPPPYAKRLLADSSNLYFLYFGSKAWLAKSDTSTSSVILPPGEPPQDFDWSCFRGKIIVGVELGQSELLYRRRLAFEVLSFGAEEVILRLSDPLIIERGVSVMSNDVTLPVIYEIEGGKIERYAR